MRMKKVNYKVKITLDKDGTEFLKDKIYECVAEWYDEKNNCKYLSVIDESKEDYVYPVSFFKKISF